MKNISQYITDESWALELSYEDVAKAVALLDDTLIRVYSNGVSTTRELANAQHLERNSCIVLAELGMVFEASCKMIAHLHADIQSHREISLTFRPQSMLESVSLSFNPDQQSRSLITLLTSNVIKTLTPQELRAVTHSERPTCPCCLDRQKAIRENASIHPLLPFLKHLAEQDRAVNVFHRGEFASSAQRIQPRSVTADKGVVYLSDKDQFCSIDLTKLYQASVCINNQHAEPFTELKGFNSHGENIVEIQQDGVEPFSQWQSFFAIPEPILS